MKIGHGRQKWRYGILKSYTVAYSEKISLTNAVLCLNTPAFSLQFIVPAQSHIKRRVVNRSIVRLFHRKNPPSKETTHAYNTFALWQLYHKRGRVINDGLSG